jgi:hypothetical protein
MTRHWDGSVKRLAGAARGGRVGGMIAGRRGMDAKLFSASELLAILSISIMRCPYKIGATKTRPLKTGPIMHANTV